MAGTRPWWVASKARGRSRRPRRAGDNAAVALVTRIPRVISSREFSRKLGIFSPFPHHSSTCRRAIFIRHPSPTNDSPTLVSPPPPPPHRREPHHDERNIVELFYERLNYEYPLLADHRSCSLCKIPISECVVAHCSLCLFPAPSLSVPFRQ